ncbi:hypothetical protein JW968_01100 [Candidatus Woesearchaeota archaeon]|nr:hypothetical protein [Candidatus Woesearchaeota archaeon]
MIVTKRLVFISILLLLIFPILSSAGTTCELDDCTLVITIKIAFQGATQDYMNRMEKEIEDVWNKGSPAYGDCRCPVRFEVITNTSADCKNSPPQGWHCIMVTDYNNNPPRNQTNWTGAEFYMGYMYNVSRTGGDTQGWWSNLMSRPIGDGTGNTYLDAAHEAGHMMGLNDTQHGGLMTHTFGPNATVNQDHIDSVVENICGDDACPDRCCCGNGQLDPGEGCDPKSDLVCADNMYCCEVCCQCHGSCNPSTGEYFSMEDCNKRCEEGSRCYYNYQTKCWNCVKLIVIPHPAVCSSPAPPVGCANLPTVQAGDSDKQIPAQCDKDCAADEACLFNYEVLEWQCVKMSDIPVVHGCRDHVDDCGYFPDPLPGIDLEEIKQLYNNNLGQIPGFAKLFADERINLQIMDDGSFFILTQDGLIIDIIPEPSPDPTMLIFTDANTVNSLLSKEMGIEEALEQGLISYEGATFKNKIKVAIVDFIYGLFFGPVDD